MLTPIELDRIARAVHHADPDPHYPAPGNRLRLGEPGLIPEADHLHVPPGPWHVTDHPNRRHAPAALLDDEAPGPHQTASWRADGLRLDQFGRPIHPDWESLLGDPRIGLPTGLGYFWRWGPNRTVDAYVERAGRRGAEVLLIRRRSGQWALPGGFVDRKDPSAQDAALRELAEETGLRIPATRTETVINRRDTGPMATLHAWTENVVYRVTGDLDYLAEAEPVAGDDAIDAAWVPLPEALAMDLFHTHAQYLALIAQGDPERQ